MNAEPRHANAIQFMRQAVNLVFEIGGERIDLLQNKALTLRRPLPLIEVGLYNAFCHGRTARVVTSRLLGGLAVHKFFRDTMNGRTLRDLVEPRSCEPLKSDELQEHRVSKRTKH